MARQIWSWIGIMLFSLAMVLVCLRFAEPYDQTKPDVDPVISWNDNFTYVQVKVIGTVEGMYYDSKKSCWKTREAFYGQQGSGFVAKDGFIFTASHVIIPDMVNTVSGQGSVHNTRPFKVLTRIILIYDYKSNPLIAKLHYLDETLDIAILKYEPNDILVPANYEIRYAQADIKSGDVVFSLLHKRDENDEMTSDLELRYGIVISNQPTTPKMGSELAWFNEYDMTIQMEIQGGDSGSPLFAFENGVPIFIGIIRANYNDEIVSLAYAVSLPNIRRYLNIGN